jgi:hypothetical protein
MRKHETIISIIRKYILEEVPEKQQEDLKELIDKDFRLLELSTNAGRDVKKRTGMLFIVHSICNSEGQLGNDRIRPVTKMTPHNRRWFPAGDSSMGWL